MNEGEQPTNSIKFLIWLVIGVGWLAEWTARLAEEEEQFTHSTTISISSRAAGERNAWFCWWACRAAVAAWCAVSFLLFHCAAEVHSINKLIPLPSLLSFHKSSFHSQINSPINLQFHFNKSSISINFLIEFEWLLMKWRDWWGPLHKKIN